MGEMDSLIVASHPECDPVTKAVHACGHNAQCANLLGAAAAMKEPGALDGLCGKIRFMAVPAEELIEVEWREELRKQGIIRYFGGKQEFIARGYMDDIDFNMNIHLTGKKQPGYMNIHKGQNGCVAKTITFHGKSVHAASPQYGINALYAANVAMTAVNALRETFVEKDRIRVHPIITTGGTVVNAIPETVKMESYIRGATTEAIAAANVKVNRAIAAAALSMGANVSIEDRPGYMPCNNDETAKLLAAEAMKLAVGEENTEVNDNWGNGCTDMGDMTTLWPTAYMHAGGATGVGHSNSYYVTDPVTGCVDAAKVLCMLTHLLLENDAAKLKEIKANYKPVFASPAEYCAFMDSLIMDGPAVTYNEDGTATVRYQK
jgi:amidohydrolase